MNDLPNPFAVDSSVSHVEQRSAEEGAEATRRRYLNHEASIKSVGTLSLLGGIFGLLLGVGYGIGSIAILGSNWNLDANANEPSKYFLFGSMLMASFIAMIGGGFSLWAGLSARRLKPKSQILMSIVAVLWLFGIPIGTLIGCYTLYLLHSSKGNFVFTPEYRQIIIATPHIKYKTSIIVKVFAGLLLCFVLLIFLMAIFA